YPRIVVACIPPVMPYSGLNDRSAALTQNADLAVAFDRQLAINGSEAFNQAGMVVLSHDTSPRQRRQLSSHPTHLIVPAALQDRAAFSRDGILPNLSDLYGCVIRRAIGPRVSHASESRTRQFGIQQRP